MAKRRSLRRRRRAHQAFDAMVKAAHVVRSIPRGVRDGYLLSKAVGRAGMSVARRKVDDAKALVHGCKAGVRAALADPRVSEWKDRLESAGRLSWSLARDGSTTARRKLRQAMRAATAASRKIRERARASLDAERGRSARSARGRDARKRSSARGAAGGGAAAKRRSGDGEAGGDEAARLAADEAARLRTEQRSHIHRILKLEEGDHYGVLQLEGGSRASARQAKSAFRKLARLLHPDKCKERRAHDAFLRLQAADETLSDADKRAEYDQKRSLERRHSAFASQSYDFGLHSNGGYARGTRSPYYATGRSRRAPPPRW